MFLLSVKDREASCVPYTHLIWRTPRDTPGTKRAFRLRVFSYVLLNYFGVQMPPRNLRMCRSCLCGSPCVVGGPVERRTLCHTWGTDKERPPGRGLCPLANSGGPPEPRSPPGIRTETRHQTAIPYFLTYCNT